MAYRCPPTSPGSRCVQCRMIAGIAHLRGYDLDRPAGARTRCWSACWARTSVRDLVARQEAAGPADGAGDRAGPRPRPRPGDLGGGRRRPGREGGRQAHRGPGRPAHPAGGWPRRRRRRRLRDLAGSAATPTASSCPWHAGRPSSRRARPGWHRAGGPASGASGTSVAGRTSRARRWAPRSASPAMVELAMQPGVLEQQRLERVDGGTGDQSPRRGGRGRRTSSAGGAPRRSSRSPMTSYPRRRISAIQESSRAAAQGCTSGGSERRGRVDTAATGSGGRAARAPGAGSTPAPAPRWRPG